MLYFCIILIILTAVSPVNLLMETMMLIGKGHVKFHWVQRTRCPLWLEIMKNQQMILLCCLYGKDVIVWWFLGFYILLTKVLHPALSTLPRQLRFGKVFHRDSTLMKLPRSINYRKKWPIYLREIFLCQHILQNVNSFGMNIQFWLHHVLVSLWLLPWN